METNLPLTPEAMVQHLRALRDQIPGYAPLSKSAARKLHFAARLDPAFVDAAINGVGASPEVQSGLGTTPEALRREADETARWTAVADELRAMLDGVNKTNLARRYRLNVTALQAYQISKQLLRKNEHPNLLIHVQEMQRLNPFGRRRLVREPETPEPPPKA
jgi:hypothetical protein